ncbi:MAG TPA: nitroreductase/quinone reductase family protein [Thermomicrobiales bacterium]|nr:nitroreductase/quinone reductase family protein [Thermomicrobiales bacterium]
MDQQIREQLQQGQTIDITTTGRKSGKPSRIEIAFQNIDGTVYISGLPGKRDWYANLVANPAFTFHLKQSLTADLPAQARPITDPAERRAVLTPFTTNWNYAKDLEKWMDGSPLVAVSFDGE